MSLAYSPHSTQLVIEITLNEPWTDDCFSLIQEAKQHLSFYLRRFQNDFGFAEGILYAPSGPTVSALETPLPSALPANFSNSDGRSAVFHTTMITPADRVESNLFLIEGDKITNCIKLTTVIQRLLVYINGILQ